MDYQLHNRPVIDPHNELAMPPSKKGISSGVGIIVIIAVAMLAMGAIYAYEYFATGQVQVDQNVVQSNQNTNQSNETAGWKTYANEKYGFEIQYPSNGKVEDGFENQMEKRLDIQMPVSGKSNLLTDTLSIIIASQQYQHNSSVLGPASCSPDAFYGYQTTDVNINGTNFKTANVSGAFGGTQSSSIATEYCIMKNDKAFILTTNLGFERYSKFPIADTTEETKVLNQMLSTFKFTK